MPKRDIFHEAVCVALEKDGWTITDDPLTVPTPGVDFHIDLGASKDLIGAKKGGQEIAVEIKSLKGNSAFYDYHQALGQFLIYRLALEMTGNKHFLYLAIPESQYLRLSKIEIYDLSWNEFKVSLLVFNENTKTIKKWISK